MSLPEFFFDRVSTEIRQQMDGILALADQLERMRPASDVQACVAGIAEAASGVSRTLDRALDLRAVANNGIELTSAPVALRAFMDAVQARWQPRARDAGVTLLTSYDGAPDARAMADEARLMQVFDGFLAEAMGGSSRRSVEVSLRAVDAGGELQLEGRIRGGGDEALAGLPFDARLKALDAQFGLEVTLGVTLARSIVRALGGKVATENNAGAGETVIFALTAPAAAPERPAIAAVEEPRPAHILVVDDNATNRVVAQALCEMLHCSSETAEDGVQALDAAKTGRFDLILMDIRMPFMDGMEATQAIRQLPGKAGRVPILALTANVDADDARRYIAIGMDGVLEKPMKADDLRRALLKALTERAAAAAA